MFIIAAANKEFRLTAGKFVPVSNVTMMNVRIWHCDQVREQEKNDRILNISIYGRN